ncbi:sensor domain-containing diguanylate cyclase [Gallaecimonas xiamenensis]|uniref:diguanylate cyclase n=1 Tax=Gallaecimonas xiamenensis 3-C-1 TaxID=745411 RepID=K2IHL7_9GAMM|nr:sensor domain-containing diguanylate cyclase [Gallaecimonas xiamenensis]EKE69596.1 sensory box/GGDEF/GAF/EAL domain protein [Gallaecimonas xiamenensis 3-C-1]
MHPFIDFLNASDELAQISEQLSEGVLVANRQGLVHFANKAARRALGNDNLLEQPLAQLLPWLSPYLEKLDFDQPRPDRSPLVSALPVALDSEGRHLRLNLSYLLASNRQPKALLVLIKDVTLSVRDRERLQSQKTRLETIIDGTRAGTWEWNVQTGENIINERWAQMLGYTKAELEPTTEATFQSFVHPDDWVGTSAKVKRHFDGELPFYDHVCRMRHRDGHWIWVHDRGRLTSRTADGKPLWVTGTHIDITDSKEAEERLSKLAKTIPGLIYQYALDRDGHSWFPYASEGIRDIYGLSPQQVQDDASLVFDRVHPDDQDALAQSISLSANSLNKWHCQYRVCFDGKEQWLEGNSIPELLDDGTVLWHGLITDITERKHLEEQLRTLSLTDELTGLYNRRHLFQALEDAYQRHQRYQTPCSVLLIDVDHFKQINDNHGHHVGDAVLKRLADLFREKLRVTDLAGRLGGEEFLVLLGDTTLEGAKKAAELLCQAFAVLDLPGDDGLPFRATLSIGVASLGQEDDEVSTLVSRADKAVYRAKHQGRNRVCLAH